MVLPLQRDHNVTCKATEDRIPPLMYGIGLSRVLNPFLVLLIVLSNFTKLHTGDVLDKNPDMECC